MTSPHVSFMERTESMHSLQSVESCLEDIFENDDIHEEDFIESWTVGPSTAPASIFTVGGGDQGYGLSPEERDYLASSPTQNDNERTVPVRYFTHKLSFRGWLRWFFIRNTSSRLAIAIFDFTLKILICASYVVRVHLDDITQYECYGVPCTTLENSTHSERDLIFEEDQVNWYVLLWVQRSNPVWIMEIFLAFIELVKSLLMVYIATKGHRMEQVMSLTFVLELLCGFNMLITLVPVLKSLFVPVFLNCWLARLALERIYNDLHLTSQRFQTVSVRLSKKMILLVMNIACLTFTTLCSIQHIQRASAGNQISLFDSFYFVIVTFSTVGFGDISPDMWLSRLFMIIMICLAFATIPSQIEGMISIYREREKAGGEYSRWFTTQKHVIVCASYLTQDTLMDFLNEFFANPKLEERTVILLCCQELDSSKRVIITDPRWSEKVIYMKGSALKDMDLKRCHAQKAYACFFLAPRPTQDKAMALASANFVSASAVSRHWPFPSLEPNCECTSKFLHVVCTLEFSHVVCLLEFLHVVCTLEFLHVKGMVLEPWQQLYGRHSANEIFHIQAQKSAIFSQYLGQTFPKTSADAHYRFGVALVAVLDSETLSPRLQLNPGPHYKIKAADMLFYISLNREEYSKISSYALKKVSRCQTSHFDMQHPSEDKMCSETDTSFRSRDPDKSFSHREADNSSMFGAISGLLSHNLTRAGCSRSNARTCMGDTSVTSDAEDGNRSNEDDTLNIPSTARSTSSSSSAPLLRGDSECSSQGGEPRRKFGRAHKPFDLSVSTDDDMNMSQEGPQIDLRHGEGRVLQFYEDMEQLTMGAPPITTCTGVGRASCHIRSAVRDPCCLEWGKSCTHCTYKNANDQRWDNQLIILVAEHASSGMFNFIVPLRSSAIGVNGLSPIILLLEEQPDTLFLESLAHFPLVYYMVGSIKSIDDLLVAGINKASHLVIVNRDPEVSTEGEEFLEDSETVIAVQTISRLFPNTYVLTALSQTANMRFMRFSASLTHSQKQLRDSTTSSMKEIFCLPFAAGQVFSANMLDTLLYQTFTKGYLISFVRLLLGIDSEQGSGHLSSIRVKKATIQRFQEYGVIYDWLSSSTGEIPFAIYRTERLAKEENKDIIARIFGGESLFDLPEKQKPKPPKYNRHARPKSNSLFNGRRFSAVCKSNTVDLGSLIRSRLQTLEMTQGDYSEVKRRRNILSYVITNPSPSEKLRIGDIIYVIQPSSMWARPSKQQFYLQRNNNSSSRLSTTSTPQVQKKNGVLKTPSREGHFDADFVMPKTDNMAEDKDGPLAASTQL
ncbi:unnamed protein product [Candidula unifasciata]|uniref:Potassium channel subfamily T member 2 n=1 Tax=Candidula unifasciata TaxID=100452 RepID=A0A8S3YEH4_9EUPU|nr:unnamed protein product [Candidula unifasciata]